MWQVKFGYPKEKTLQDYKFSSFGPSIFFGALIPRGFMTGNACETMDLLLAKLGENVEMLKVI